MLEGMDLTGGAGSTSLGGYPIPQGAPDVAAIIQNGAMPKGQNGIQRDEPEIDPAQQKNVLAWQAKIKRAKKKWEKDFKRMREDMSFAWGKQWPEGGEDLDGDKYIANIVQQHIRQKVASLYAKNPKFVVKKRDRMFFKYWDEKPETLQMAQQTLMTNHGDPIAATILQDYQAGTLIKQRIDKIGTTLETLFGQQLHLQTPNFKKQMKQTVRRALTCGVAYAKLGFQREMKPRPDTETQIADATNQIARIQSLAADQADGLSDTQSAEVAELQNSVKALQEQDEVILREGLVFSFPKATALIPDDKIRSLEGWLGADWLVEEFIISPAEIKDVYKVDVGKQYRAYAETDGVARETNLFTDSDDRFNNSSLAVVWEIYDRKSGTFFALCEGYKGYLRAPCAPDVIVDQFFPYVALMFNEMEHDSNVFPLGDCRLLRSIQKEYNRAKEALRQHRIAAAPLYAAGAGVFDEEDQKNLALHEPHDTIIIKGLGENENINNKLQQVKKHNIDPNVYETQTIFGDMLRVVGTSDESNGNASNATATATSIAADSRQSSTASDADDLDEFLARMANMAGQISLKNFSQEQVVEICGQGAIWPKLTMKEIMDDLYLDIEAGSSGRPNKGAKAAAFERVGQLLMSIPGVQPRWMLKQLLQAVDENIDLTEAYAEGQPSILMLNRIQSAAQATPMNPMANPEDQGGQGFENSPAMPGQRPGGQPGFPAPNAQRPGAQQPRV